MGAKQGQQIASHFFYVFNFVCSDVGSRVLPLLRLSTLALLSCGNAHLTVFTTSMSSPCIPLPGGVLLVSPGLPM